MRNLILLPLFILCEKTGTSKYEIQEGSLNLVTCSRLPQKKELLNLCVFASDFRVALKMLSLPSAGTT